MQSEAAAPALPTPGRRRWVHVAAFAIGAVGLVLLVDRTGWSALAVALARIGAWFAVIAAIDLVAIACDAGALHAFANAHDRVSYARVFAAQASGAAINRLTPGNALGEPLKVTMLLGELPRSSAVAAVVMFNVTTMWVAIGTILLGLPLMLISLDLPLRAEIAVWIASAALLGIGVALAVIVRRGAVAVPIAALARLGVISRERAARWQTSVGAIDAGVRRAGRVRRGTMFVIGSRLLYTAGTIVLMAAAGLPLAAPLVLASASIGILIAWVSNIVPLGVGIADGSNYALYGALGATGGAGLVFTMATRARTCVFALLGLGVMGLSGIALDETRRR